MPPIRIALIGLSQAAKTSWAAEGHLPYLLSERGKSRFKIVALLNSSEAAAKKAIQAYNLPADVKAYGSPSELAKDSEVDLVVCTTRVDVHFDTIKPSVEAGKNVFVEWPLAENAVRAAELAALARQSGSKTVLGLQTRVAPQVLKVKQLIQQGKIGKVVSSELTAFTPGGGGFEMSPGLAYFLNKKVGGNPVTIGFAHTIDFVHSVLGEYKSSHAQTQIQRPEQTIVNKETGERTPMISDVPDLVSLHGTLQASEYVKEDATLVANFRSGPAFPGTTPFVWTITGELGRIQISNERGPYLGSIASGFPTPIKVQIWSAGEAEEVPEVSWDWEDWQEPLLTRGKNIGKLYDLYFDGKLEELGAADFDAAVLRHEQIDQILN